jgi:catechol 2,3-dioxygenase-like lactoylglutathione lyase family enzyme
VAYHGRLMSIRRVVPHLSPEDWGTSRDFYVELLGFKVAMDMDWIMTLASPSNPTAQISLQRAGATPSPNMTIEVDDVDRVHSAAQERGDEIVYPLKDEDWGVRRFFVRDPNGLVINVMRHND